VNIGSAPEREKHKGASGALMLLFSLFLPPAQNVKIAFAFQKRPRGLC
jgi:hypothetical protein